MLIVRCSISGVLMQTKIVALVSSIQARLDWARLPVERLVKVTSDRCVGRCDLELQLQSARAATAVMLAVQIQQFQAWLVFVS